MKIIVPMAGMGKRMRPHTLTVPKPLIPVAGKPIVQWLVEDITRMSTEKVDEIAYVVGHFGDEVEQKLKSIAEGLGAKGTIHYQEEALGTAHAILCAEDALKGKIIVAFADTLFRADFKIESDSDGVIWVNKIDDPRMFGVVKVDNGGIITDFVEKPQTFVSDLAIIGIYYFKDGEQLRREMQFLIDNNIRDKGEYQLTSALENMKKKGVRFRTGKVSEWLDCGNKDATVYTNGRVLEMNKGKKLVSTDVKLTNAVIVEPCYIGENVEIISSVIGPYVSLGSGSVIENSVVRDSIVGEKTKIKNSVLENSMIGNHAEYMNASGQLSLSDYSTHK